MGAVGDGDALGGGVEGLLVVAVEGGGDSCRRLRERVFLWRFLMRKEVSFLSISLFLFLLQFLSRKEKNTHVEPRACVGVGRGDVAVDVRGGERGEEAEVEVVFGVVRVCVC